MQNKCVNALAVKLANSRVHVAPWLAIHFGPSLRLWAKSQWPKFGCQPCGPTIKKLVGHRWATEKLLSG